MKVIIDRFEEEFAVVEINSGKMVICPREIFPDNAKEGDVVLICIDETETKDKIQNNTERMNKLFRD